MINKSLMHHQANMGKYINTLRPRQNCRHFSADIFKSIFLNENEWISIKILLKFVSRSPINNIPALFQIMAWRRPGDKPLSEPMMVRLPTHICVTRPQWVNLSSPSAAYTHQWTGSASKHNNFHWKKCISKHHLWPWPWPWPWIFKVKYRMVEIFPGERWVNTLCRSDEIMHHWFWSPSVYDHTKSLPKSCDSFSCDPDKYTSLHFLLKCFGMNNKNDGNNNNNNKNNYILNMIVTFSRNNMLMACRTQTTCFMIYRIIIPKAF